MPTNMVMLVGRFVSFNLDKSITIGIDGKLATVALPNLMYDKCYNILEANDFVGIKGHIEFEPNVMIVADKISTLKSTREGGEEDGEV